MTQSGSTNSERDDFEAWFEQWRVSTWWTLRSEPKDQPCPAHWAAASKIDCERGWNARASLAAQEPAVAAINQPEAADDLSEALTHLHWLTRGGEFAYWMETEKPAMPYAAVREYQDARAFVKVAGIRKYQRGSAPPTAAPVPAGWVLVPIEPTEAMWDAGRDPVMYRELSHYRPAGQPVPPWQINPDGTVEKDTSKGTTAVHVWRAMLAAAPKGTGD